jgi:hypothetical protein
MYIMRVRNEAFVNKNLDCSEDSDECSFEVRKRPTYPSEFV